MEFREILEQVVEFREKKIPEATAKGHLKHLGEETMELAMEVGNNYTVSKVIEEVADVVITALLVGIEFTTTTSLEQAILDKLQVCLNSDWRKVNPGMFKRVK